MGVRHCNQNEPITKACLRARKKMSRVVGCSIGIAVAFLPDMKRSGPKETLPHQPRSLLMFQICDISCTRIRLFVWSFW